MVRFFLKVKLMEAAMTYFKAMLRPYTQGLSEAAVTHCRILYKKCVQGCDIVQDNTDGLN